MEEHRKEQEAIARLAAIVNSSEDAIIGKTPDGIITSWNKAAEKIYGYSEKEVLGKSIFVIIPDEYRDQTLQTMQKVKDGKSIEHFDTVRRRKDGRLVDVSVSISPIVDPSGRIIGHATIAHDITVKKKLEERLATSETRFKTLYEASSDAIMVLVPGKEFIAGNPATVKLFGCRDEKEFISKSPAELSPERQPDGRLSSDKSREMMNIAMEKGRHYFEWKHKKINGEEFFASVMLTKMHIEGKDALQATVRDITARKINEERLKAAAEEWGKTFNAISDMIFIQDITHGIIKVNEAFAKAMGKAPNELIGRKCYEVLHKLDKPWPLCPVEKSKADKKTHSEIVDDPSIGIPLLVTASPVFDDKGNIVSIVHVAKDISQIKKTEVELRKKIEELERFQKVTVGRELRMKELKGKIAELEQRLAQK